MCAMWCRWSDVPFAVRAASTASNDIAHRPVPDRVHVHLEAVGVELGDARP